MRFLASAALTVLVSGCVKYSDIPHPHSGACLESARHRRSPSENLIDGKAVGATELDRLLLDDPRSHAAQRRAQVLGRGVLPTALLYAPLLLGGAIASAVGDAKGNDQLAIGGIATGGAAAVLLVATSMTLLFESDRARRHAFAILNDAAAASGQCPP